MASNESPGGVLATDAAGVTLNSDHVAAVDTFLNRLGADFQRPKGKSLGDHRHRQICNRFVAVRSDSSG